MATSATFRIWRGDPAGGAFQDYTTPVEEGMVVLDAVHRIQAQQAPDLAVRWNCKAGKCGSCSAEINGMPRLMCMTRLSDIDLNMPVIVEPMHAFPVIRDLVTDVSWNFRAKKTIKQFKPRPPDAADGTWRIQQADVERVQEFRKCIECFLCQDVCHVLREHHKHDEFIGPRLLVYAAALEMHPLDTEDRVSDLRHNAQHRLLQHHYLLPAGVSRVDHDHRERDYSAQGARGGPLLRSPEAAVPHPLTESQFSQYRGDLLSRRGVLGIERNQFLFQFTPFIGWILKQPHATIPAKDGIVVSRRADFLRLCERV